MGFPSPNNSSEILYGSSGDVRNEVNAYAITSQAGHYVDETEIPGNLIIRGLERATRLINGYLEVVYSSSIPITAAANVPVLLDDIASDLATYFTLRANVARVGPISSEKKNDYYDQYINEETGILALIRERKIQITEFTAVYGDEVKAVRAEGQAPIFDVDSEFNWNTDTRTIDDIEKERDA